MLCLDFIRWMERGGEEVVDTRGVVFLNLEMDDFSSLLCYSFFRSLYTYMELLDRYEMNG